MVTLYEFGLKYNNTFLETLSFKHMLDNGHFLLTQSDVYRLQLSTILALLSHDDFCCFENDIANFVLKYSHNKSDDALTPQLLQLLFSAVRLNSIASYDNFYLQCVILCKYLHHSMRSLA